jgi:homogentisate 1,2-dioxygenase
MIEYRSLFILDCILESTDRLVPVDLDREDVVGIVAEYQTIELEHSPFGVKAWLGYLSHKEP